MFSWVRQPSANRSRIQGRVAVAGARAVTETDAWIEAWPPEGGGNGRQLAVDRWPLAGSAGAGDEAYDKGGFCRIIICSILYRLSV